MFDHIPYSYANQILNPHQLDAPFYYLSRSTFGKMAHLFHLHFGESKKALRIREILYLVVTP